MNWQGSCFLIQQKTKKRNKMLNKLYQKIKRLRNKKGASQRGQEFLKEMREQFDAYSERRTLERRTIQKTINSP